MKDYSSRMSYLNKIALAVTQAEDLGFLFFLVAASSSCFLLNPGFFSSESFDFLWRQTGRQPVLLSSNRILRKLHTAAKSRLYTFEIEWFSHFSKPLHLIVGYFFHIYGLGFLTVLNVDRLFRIHTTLSIKNR